MLLGVLLFAVSCSTDPQGDQAAGDNEVTGGDEVVSASEAFEDFDSSEMGLEDLTSFDVTSQVFLKNALGEMTRRCMAEAGFEYQPYIYRDQDIVEVFRTPEQLRSSGYSVIEAEWSRDFDPNQSILAELSTEERTAWTNALFGLFTDHIKVLLPNGETVSMSSSGCVGQGTAAVFGSIEDAIVYEDILYNMTGDGVYVQMIADPRHQELASAWRSCLIGRDVDVPEQAHFLKDMAVGFYAEMSEADALQAEMSLAEDDASCLEESGLDALRTSLVGELQSEIAATGDFDVARAAAFQQYALDRAQSLLTE